MFKKLLKQHTSYWLKERIVQTNYKITIFGMLHKVIDIVESKVANLYWDNWSAEMYKAYIDKLNKQIEKDENNT